MEYKLFKYGEAIAITDASIQSSDSVLSDPEINDRFMKLAGGLKRIAPKANDFLYFSAVMMHAAEASTVNPDGTPKKLASGQPVSARWEKKGESVRWVCNDPTVPPYRNSNGDIFPEEELIKAYKKWVGKPLCIDHKSSSVDFVRGVIIDTYYDRVAKRVIALCALDKVSFPELARKVATGVSTCVSMGTAVGRAVCSDCGTVARTEHDFCNHMRTKSCYGEINLDLQPIELSIVVNGADPQAKIRHILASANYLNRRAEEAEKELSSLAETDSEKVPSLRNVVSNIKEGLDSLIREFEGSGKSESQSEEILPEEDLNKSASEQSEVENAENIAEAVKTTDNLESVTAASEDTDALKEKFNSLKEAIQQKLSKIEEDFNTLSKLGDGSRDNTMEKKSYFQGAGDVNEPTPGQPKYEKDPLAEKTRNTEDRQMTGIANTGPVDGLFPGDQEKKNLLARAEEDKRSERRKTALEKAKARLEKGAYFQGTEEPTPGKPQYAKEDADSIRDKEDKQMTGQAPFPAVGKVDGLHPSPASADQKDELKRKEMLARASLKAKFVKAATPAGEPDHAASAWQVFANDKLVFSASVKELSGGRVDALYSVIASKPYAVKMLEKIKEVGFEKAAALYKGAQMPEIPAAPMGDAAAPLPAADESATSAVEEADKGGVGSPADQLAGIAKDAKEMGETLEELANTMKEEDPSASMEGLAPATASLQKMRVELHAALLAGVTKVASDLAENLEEVALFTSLYEDNSVNDSNREYVETMSVDAIADTKATLAEANELLGSFVNYARGTEVVLKQAAKESEMTKIADDAGMDAKLDELLQEMEGAEEAAPDTLSDADLAPPTEKDPAVEMDAADAAVEAAPMAADADDTLIDLDDANAAMVEMKKEDLAKLPDNAKVEVKMAEFDLSTREGRTAARMKLAAEAGKFSPVLNDAHKHVSQKSDAGDLGKVETLEETHKATLDLATAGPKVRKDAEELLGLVKAGKLAHEDVDALVSHGLDPEVVKYYKELWKEVEGGSEFAGELVKEHAKAKLDEEMAAYKVKVARAYGLAYEMVERGLCSREASVLSAQVDEIMKYNDDAFDSLKRVVAKHAPLSLKKEAARVPQVGLLGNDEPTTAAEPEDLFSSLNRAFANRRY